MASTLRWLSGLFKSSTTALDADQDPAHPSMILEELESRTLFSADPVSGLLNTPELREQESVQSIPIESLLIDNESENISIPLNSEIRNELIFIDEAVTDYDQLINDLTSGDSDSRNFTVFVLDNKKDGVDQITAELQNYQGLDAVHIISHGTQGTVTLGNTQLNSTNLDDYSSSISLWQNSFDENADLLIYGCELAGNFAGESLTTELSALTGTDVAASDDNTGNIQLGGDWELEFSIGTIETEIAFSKEIQHSWDGLLAYQTYRDEFNTVSLTNSDGTQDWTSGGWQEIGDDDDVNTGDVTVSTVLGEQGLSIKNSGNGVLREVDLSAASNATLSFDYARISLDDANRVVVLQISGDGGGSWSELSRWQGMADDTQLQYASFDISDYIASDTQIQFVTSGFNDPSDEFFIDNIQIAYASQLTTTPEFVVNQSTTNTQQTSAEDRGSTQAVAVAPNGDYVVVWSSQNQDAGGWGVFAQKYDRQGNMSGSEIQVNVDAVTEASDQQWSSIAMDDNGNFVIVWSGSGSGDSDGVFYRRFNADGTSADPKEVLVNTTITGVQDNATVAMDGNGNFVIIWEGNGNQPGNIDSDGVFGQLFDASGTTVGGEFLVNPSSGSNEGEPAVAMDDSGNFVVVWDDAGGVQGQLYSNTGAVQNGFTIDPSNSAGEASVAMDADGDFVVAWRETGFGKAVYALRFDALGNQKDASAILINTTIFGDQTNPSVDLDAAGNFIIVWEGTGSGDTSGVFGRKFNADGTPVTGEFLINQTTTNTQHMASVAMLSLNDSVVVWSGEGSGDSSGVFARQLGAVIANAGSAHVINEGDSVTLNGSNSLNSDGSPLTFSWDLNGDGTYGDVVGENLTVDWVILQSFGIIDNGTYTIGLQVDDGKGGVDTSTTTITINNKAPVLSTTGSSTVDQNSVYTLNLSVTDPGEDTISSWTINWGDGTIETFSGNPAAVTHTYTTGGYSATNDGFTYNILASVTDEDGTHLQNDLLVTDFTNNGGIYHYSETGEFLELIGNTDLDKSIGVIVGPDGNWYGTGEVSGNVYRYNTDGNTSKVIATGFGEADGLAFGPDGNLYVADWVNNVVYKITHNTTDDSYTKTAITISTPINNPYGVVFGPDGHLYVSSYSDHSVHRLEYNENDPGDPGDPNDDTFTESVYISGGLGGLNSPEQMAFGPDGKLYLTSAGSNEILRYNPETSDMDVIATLPSGGKPEGIAFGPDGNLYISDHDNGDIIRFNLVVNDISGKLEVSGVAETFIDGANSGLTRPVFMTFIPEQQVTVTPSANTLPTLTTFSNVITTTNEDTEVEITFLDLQLQGNEFDAEGAINSFVVNEISSGILKIGTSAATATAWVAVSNDKIDASNHAYWTPDLNANGTLNAFAVVAEDQQGAISIGNIIAQVEVNDAPTITSSLTPGINENTTFVQALTATDPQNDTVTFSITGGNDAALFEINTSKELQFISAPDYESPTDGGLNNIYDVEITADDGNGGVDIQLITVSVINDNEAPTLVILSAITVNENIDTSGGYTVGILTTTDEDIGDSTTYTINGGTDASLFTISGNNLVLTDGVLDFETQSSYNVIVKSTDSGSLTHDQSFTINVNDQNEAPVFDSTAITTASQDTLYSYTINTNDVDGDGLTISATTKPIWLSFTDNGNGTATLSGTPDNSHVGDHNVVLSVSDGSLVDTQSFTLTVSNTNDAPIITSNGGVTSAAINVAENQTAVTTVTVTDADVLDTSTFSITGGVDQGLFSITSAGVLSFNSGKDFETKTDSNTDGVYEVEITASDGNGGTDVQTILVTITDVNEAPTLTSFSGINEASFGDKNIEITFSELIDQGNEADVDGTIVGFVVKTVNSGTLNIGTSVSTATAWVSGTNDSIDSINKAYWTPSQDANGTFDAFSIVAKDDQGLESTNQVIAQVNISALNNAPVINNQTFSIPENSLDGTLVGKVTASDLDSVDFLSFSIIAGNSNNAFSINSSTGEITVTDSTQLDFENFSDFIVTVQVTDNGVGRLSDTASIGINLTNIDESPDSITLTNKNIDNNIETSSGYKVGSLNASDVDAGDTFTYTIIGGEDQLHFTIGGVGNDELIISDGVSDFENQSSYEVTVRVTDSAGLSHDQKFTVTINQLANSEGTTTEQIEVKTEPNNQGLDVVPLLETSFSESIASIVNQETEGTSSNVGDVGIGDDEVEADKDKSSLLTTQYTPEQGGIRNVVNGIDNESLSTLSEQYGDQRYNNARVPFSMRVEATVPGSDGLFDAKLRVVTVDESALQYLFEKSGFSNSLDSLREQIKEKANFEKMVVGSSLSVTTGLSIGYVIWLIRGGVLLSSVLSSLPAWRMIDPLPIISRLNDSDNADEGDSLESLVKKGKEAAKSKFKLKLNPVAGE